MRRRGRLLPRPGATLLVLLLALVVASSVASLGSLDPHTKIEILEPHHQRTRLSSLLHLGHDEEAVASHDEDPIERAVRRVQAILEEDEGQGWEVVKHNEGSASVTVLRKLLPGLDDEEGKGGGGSKARFCCIKAQGVVRASPSALLELLADGSKCREYNSFYSQGKPIEMLDPYTKVVWTATPSLWLFKARDFCTAIHWRRLSNGAVAVINRCFHHPAAPPTSRFVRGQVLLGASVVRPVPGDPQSCHLTVINHLDPGGSAPSSLVNRLAAMGPPSFFTRIEAAAARLEEERRRQRGGREEAEAA